MTHPTDPLDEILDSYAKYQYQLHVDNDGSRQMNKLEAKAALKHLIEQETIKAERHILRGFRRRDFVSGDFYEHAIIDRLAALEQKLGDKL
jgi:hypothetical protein